MTCLMPGEKEDTKILNVYNRLQSVLRELAVGWSHPCNLVELAVVEGTIVRRY